MIRIRRMRACAAHVGGGKRRKNGLFRDSFKWMLLVLGVIALLIGAALGILLPADDASQKRLAATETPSPTPARTPAPTLPPTPSPTPSPTVSPEPKTVEEMVERYVSGMSVEEKLGQMAMFGFSGDAEISGEFAAVMETYRIGNAILYGGNIKSGNSDGGFGQCAKLTDDIKAHLSGEIPPLICIDVEGGSVVRFRWQTHPVSARSLGRRRDAAFAFEQFEVIAHKLRTVGINFDLAPVLDVSQNPMDTFLETRIISEDAAIAAGIGESIIEGLHSGGCLSAAKHFPGHGGTNEDSHAVTPVVDRSLEELLAYDLVPFQAAIETGVDAIIVSHILYPALDETSPASISEPIISGLLRGQMGFEGLVVSDDFRMAGLTNLVDPGEAAVRFILAGGDIVLCGAQHDRQIAIMDALYAAAQSGRISPARIDESVRRILKSKLAVTDWDIAAALLS